MLIAVTNPTPTKKKKLTRKTAPAKRRTNKKVETMAKKHRSAAQKAATRRMIAGCKRARHSNPSPRHGHVHHHRKGKRRSVSSYRRKCHRNPSPFGNGKGILTELLSLEGALMVGAAFVAPMATDWIQEKIMPSASGWTKIAVKAALVGGVAWVIDKYGKQRKAALAYAVTGAAVLASDAVRLSRGKMAGLSDNQADYLSTRPELANLMATGELGDPYQLGMAEAYEMGLSESNDTFGSSF